MLAFSSFFSEIALSYNSTHYGWPPNPKFISGDYNIQMPAGRPNSIYPAIPNYNRLLTQSGVGTDYPVGMSRHHIIPFNTLRDFYTNLVNRGDVIFLRRRLGSGPSFLERLASSIPIYYEGAGRDCDAYEYRNEITDIINFIFSIGLNLIHQIPYPALRPEGFDNFISIYSWLPGNIFIGPTNRSDDPHSGFDINAHIIVGYSRASNLRQIYNLMTAYNQGRQIDFRDLSSKLQRVTNIREPFALRHSNWLYNRIEDKYFINTHPDPLDVKSNKDIKPIPILSEDETCDELSKIYDDLERKLIIIIS